MSVTADLGFSPSQQSPGDGGLALANTTTQPRFTPLNHGRTPSQNQRVSRLQNSVLAPAPISRESASLPARSPAIASYMQPAVVSDMLPAGGMFASIEQSAEDDWMEFQSLLRGGQLIKSVEPGDILLRIDSEPIEGLR